MDNEKRPPLGGYKDQTTSLHLTSELLSMVRAAATATHFNQSDIFRIGVQRYVEIELVPNMTPTEKDRYELALKMEQENLSRGIETPTLPPDDYVEDEVESDESDILLEA